VFYKAVYDQDSLTVSDPVLEEGFPGKQAGIAGPSQTSQLTVSVRAKFTDTNVNSGIISKGSLKEAAFAMYHEAGSGFRAVLSTDVIGKVELRADVSVSSSGYYYLILVYDGQRARFYVDGHLMDEKDVSGFLKTNYDSFLLGSSQGYAQLSGTIDRALVCIEALTGSQIYDLIYGTSFSDVVSRTAYDQRVFTFIPPGIPSVEAFWYGKDGTDYSFSYQSKLAPDQGGLGYDLPSASTWTYFVEKVVKPSLQHAAGSLGMTAVRIPLSWVTWEADNTTFISRFKDVVNAAHGAGLLSVPILWSGRGHPGDNSISVASSLLITGDQPNPGDVLINKWATGGSPAQGQLPMKTLSPYDNFIGPYKVNYLACTAQGDADAHAINVGTFVPLKNVRAGVEDNIVVNSGFEERYRANNVLCLPSDGSAITDGSYWRPAANDPLNEVKTVETSDPGNPLGAFSGQGQLYLKTQNQHYISAALQGRMNHFDHVNKIDSVDSLSYIHLPPGGNYKLSFRIARGPTFNPDVHKVVALVANENSAWKDRAVSKYWNPSSYDWSSFSNGAHTGSGNTDLFQGTSGLPEEWIELDSPADDEWSYRSVCFSTNRNFYKEANSTDFSDHFNPDGSNWLPFLSNELPDGYTIAIGVYSGDGTTAEVYVDEADLRLLATDYDVRAHFNPRNTTDLYFTPVDDSPFTLQDLVDPRTGGYGADSAYADDGTGAGYVFRKSVKNAFDLDDVPVQLQNPGARQVRRGREFFKSQRNEGLPATNVDNVNGGDAYIDDLVTAMRELGEDKFFAIELFDRPFDMRRLGVTNTVDAHEMDDNDPFGYIHPQLGIIAQPGNRWPVCDEYRDISRFIAYTRGRIAALGNLPNLPMYIAPRRPYVYQANLLNLQPDDTVIVEGAEDSVALLEIDNAASAGDPTDGIYGVASRHMPVTIYGVTNSDFKVNNDSQVDDFRMTKMFGLYTHMDLDPKKHDLFGIGSLAILAWSDGTTYYEPTLAELAAINKTQGSITHGFLPRISDKYDFGILLDSNNEPKLLTKAFALLQKSERTAGAIDSSFIKYGKEGDSVIRNDDGAQWQWFVQDLSGRGITGNKARMISQKEQPQPTEFLEDTPFADLVSTVFPDFDVSQYGFIGFELTDTPIHVGNPTISSSIVKQWVDAYVLTADSITSSPYNLLLTEVGGHLEEITNPYNEHTFYTPGWIFPNIPVANSINEKIPWILRVGSLVNDASFLSMPSGSQGYGSAGAMGSMGYISVTAGTMGSKGYIWDGDQWVAPSTGADSVLNWAAGCIYIGARGWESSAFQVYGLNTDVPLFSGCDVPAGNRTALTSGEDLTEIIQYWNNRLVDTNSVYRTVAGLSLAQLTQSRIMPKLVAIPKFLSFIKRHVYLGTTRYDLDPTFSHDDTDITKTSDSQFQTSVRIGPDGKLSFAMFASRSGTATLDIPMKTKARFTGIDIFGNLSALGVFEDDITTFHIEFDDLETKIVVLDYDIPELPVSDNDCSHLWGMLGDFWSAHFEDRPAICAMWNAFVDITSDALLHLYQYDAGKSILSIPPLIAATSRALVQDENLLIEGATSNPRYFVSSEINSIPVLSSGITWDVQKYFEGQDYTIDGGIWSILNTSMPDISFAHRLLYDEQTLYKNFGFLANLQRDSSQNFKDIVQAAWSMLWNAMTPSRVDTLVQSLLGLPIIPLGTKVIGYRLEQDQHILSLQSAFDGVREVTIPLFITPSSSNPIRVMSGGTEQLITSYSQLVGLDIDSNVYPLAPFPRAEDWKSDSVFIQKVASALKEEGARIVRTFFIRIPFNYYSYLAKQMLASGVISSADDFLKDADRVLTAGRVASATHMFMFEVTDTPTIDFYKEDPGLVLKVDLTTTLAQNYFWYHLVNKIFKEGQASGSGYLVTQRQSKLIVLQDDDQASIKAYNGRPWPRLVQEYSLMNLYLADEEEYGRQDSSSRGLNEAIGVSHSGNITATSIHIDDPEPLIELEKEEEDDGRKFATVNFDEDGVGAQGSADHDEHSGILPYGGTEITQYSRGSDVIPWTMMDFDSLPKTVDLGEYMTNNRGSTLTYPKDFEFYDYRWSLLKSTAGAEIRNLINPNGPVYEEALKHNKGFHFSGSNEADSCMLLRTHRFYDLSQKGMRVKAYDDNQAATLVKQANTVWDTHVATMRMRFAEWDKKNQWVHFSLARFRGHNNISSTTLLAFKYQNPLPPNEIIIFFAFYYLRTHPEVVEYWYSTLHPSKFLIIDPDVWINMTVTHRSNTAAAGDAPNGALALTVNGNTVGWDNVLTTQYGFNGLYSAYGDTDEVALYAGNENVDIIYTQGVTPNPYSTNLESPPIPNGGQRVTAIFDSFGMSETSEGELINENFDGIEEGDFSQWDSVTATTDLTPAAINTSIYRFNDYNAPRQLDDATKIYGDNYRLEYNFKYFIDAGLALTNDATKLSSYTTGKHAVPIFGINLMIPGGTTPSIGFGIYLQRSGGVDRIYSAFHQLPTNHWITNVLDPDINSGDVALANPIDFNVLIEITEGKIVYQITALQLDSTGDVFPGFKKTEIAWTAPGGADAGTGIVKGVIIDPSLLTMWNQSYVAQEWYGPRILPGMDSKVQAPGTTWGGSAYVYDVKSYVSKVGDFSGVTIPDEGVWDWELAADEKFLEDGWWTKNPPWDGIEENIGGTVGWDSLHQEGRFTCTADYDSNASAIMSKVPDSRTLRIDTKFRYTKPDIFHNDTFISLLEILRKNHQNSLKLCIRHQGTAIPTLAFLGMDNGSPWFLPTQVNVIKGQYIWLRIEFAFYSSGNEGALTLKYKYAETDPWITAISIGNALTIFYDPFWPTVVRIESNNMTADNITGTDIGEFYHDDVEISEYIYKPSDDEINWSDVFEQDSFGIDWWKGPPWTNYNTSGGSIDLFNNQYGRLRSNTGFGNYAEVMHVKSPDGQEIEAIFKVSVASPSVIEDHNEFYLASFESGTLGDQVIWFGFKGDNGHPKYFLKTSNPQLWNGQEYLYPQTDLIGRIAQFDWFKIRLKFHTSGAPDGEARIWYRKSDTAGWVQYLKAINIYTAEYSSTRNTVFSIRNENQSTSTPDPGGDFRFAHVALNENVIVGAVFDFDDHKVLQPEIMPIETGYTLSGHGSEFKQIEDSAASDVVDVYGPSNTRVKLLGHKRDEDGATYPLNNDEGWSMELRRDDGKSAKARSMNLKVYPKELAGQDTTHGILGYATMSLLGQPNVSASAYASSSDAGGITVEPINLRRSVYGNVVDLSFFLKIDWDTSYLYSGDRIRICQCLIGGDSQPAAGGADLRWRLFDLILQGEKLPTAALPNPADDTRPTLHLHAASGYNHGTGSSSFVEDVDLTHGATIKIQSNFFYPDRMLRTTLFVDGQEKIVLNTEITDTMVPFVSQLDESGSPIAGLTGPASLEVGFSTLDVNDVEEVANIAAISDTRFINVFSSKPISIIYDDIRVYVNNNDYNTYWASHSLHNTHVRNSAIWGLFGTLNPKMISPKDNSYDLAAVMALGRAVILSRGMQRHVHPNKLIDVPSEYVDPTHFLGTPMEPAYTKGLMFKDNFNG
jgi:hypothetical protein